MVVDMKNIKFIFHCFRLNVKKEWQYKSSFFMQIFMMVLNNLSFIAVLAILFTVVDNIGGMNFNQVAALFAVTCGGYAVMHMFFYGAFDIKDNIYNARLDVFMTQPKNLLLNVSCSSTSVSAIGDLICGIIILVITRATWWWYAVYIPIAITAGLIYFGMYVFWISFAFYIKAGDAIAKVAEDITLKASAYPRAIYDNFAKLIFATIIPVTIYVFLPVEFIFINFQIWPVLAILGGTIIWLVLAFTFFKISVRRYTSGSVMGGRY